MIVFFIFVQKTVSFISHLMNLSNPVSEIKIMSRSEIFMVRSSAYEPRVGSNIYDHLSLLSLLNNRGTIYLWWYEEESLRVS